MLGIARLVLEITGSRSPVAFRPLPADDPTCRCPDINLTRRLLDRRPSVGLREDGLGALAAAVRRIGVSPPARRAAWR